jgi:hypothetical protein
VKYNTISAAYQEHGVTSSCYPAGVHASTCNYVHYYVILQHKPRLCSY